MAQLNASSNRRLALLACAALSLGACAWESPAPALPKSAVAALPVPVGPADPASRDLAAQRAARTAHSMVGVPYRWGGTSPSGFDCSGLVHFAYAAHGVTVPRTAARLFDTARPVGLDQARAGDLVFFRSSAKGGHVGILLDRQRFVHAPSSGKRVSIGNLSQPWYHKRLIRAGRIDIQSGSADAAMGGAYARK